jgi:hypothetical protein
MMLPIVKRLVFLTTMHAVSVICSALRYIQRDVATIAAASLARTASCMSRAGALARSFGHRSSSRSRESLSRSALRVQLRS